MKNRIAALLLALILVLAPCGVRAESEFLLELTDPDTFLTEYAEDAVPLEQSETLHVAYRVSDANSLNENVDAYWMVRFELALENKTTERLEGLTFTIHLNEQMQKIMPVGSWWIEPVSLNACTAEDLSSQTDYEWTTLIDLTSLGMTRGLTLEDFYQVMFEVTWEDGSEILRVSPETAVSAADDLLAPLAEECGTLDEEVVRQMNEAGAAARIRSFGE